MLTVSIVILGLLLIPNYFFLRDIAYPPLIQNILWVIILILISAFEMDFFPISVDVYIAIVFAVTGFSLGGALLYSKYTYTYTDIKVIPHKSYTKTLKLLTLGAAVIFPFFLLRIFYIADGSLSDNFFYRLREALVSDDGANMFGIGYYFYFCVILFSLQLIVADKILTWKNLLYFLLPLIVAILFVQKGFVLLLLCCAAGVIIVQRRVNIIKAILITGIIFSVAFFLLISLRQINPEDNDTGVAAIVKIYLLAGLPALTELLNHGESGNGEHVFRGVLVWLNRFGFEFTIIPMLQEFVAVPFGTNVYTYLRPYILDFGLLGVFLFNVFLGSANGYIYGNARKGSAPYTVLYGLMLYPLIMQFFDDQYFQILSLWVYIGVFLFLFFSVSRYTIIATSESRK